MPKATVKTTRPDVVELEYDTFGSSADPALLLVMGFTAQMTAWDERFCRLLADGGRYVIRFDNRDCGLSTKIEGQEVDLVAVLAAVTGAGELPPVPYTLSDFGNDCIGLLDALGIGQAHVVGASMGGMIVQTLAIEHADRLLSMTSIMSSTGDSAVGKASPEAMAVLLTPPPAERDAYVEQAAATMVWQSKRYGNAEEMKRRAASAYDRSFYPQGAPRQLAAIYASGDRTEALKAVTVPSLVIHGRDDALIDPSGGAATAAAIAGSHHLLVADMGHDLPEPLWPLIAGTVLTLGAA
jgi:pimeloyl-ACP methyl ester carboxylesterase